MPRYRVISRSSPLARVQLGEALSSLANYGAHDFETIFLESLGDKDKSLSLLEGQAPGDLFTRELDEALRGGLADFAVHSAKDLDLPLAPDLEIYALLPAADRSDCLVGPWGRAATLEDLPAGARIGTSSPQRRAELLAVRPDLTIVSIRGTIAERIAQVDEGGLEAVVMATCALKRLGLSERISQILAFETHPLQGHLAITGLSRREDLRDLWGPLDVRQGWGRVYLVGAGPGDPELLTLKARRLISEADVIFYDALANPLILDGIRAELVFVGKRRDEHSKTQDEINELLADAARSGRKTLRLKGGDPLLFGRGSEEIDFLRSRLVDVEVVPGVSSAMAAAAYAEIPLTQRNISASVAFCTGYPPEKIQAPNAETRVYFMGASTLPLILEKNLRAGVPGSTPIALIHNASLPDQRVWRSTLDRLAAGPMDFPSPLLIIIGEVVKPGSRRNWFEERPLVWYTGTNPDHFDRRARVLHLPLIEIRPLADYGPVDDKLNRLGDYDWTIFTSRYTVRYVLERLTELGLDARAFSGQKIAAVGRATARELEGRGLMADLIPELESSEGLVALFKAEAVPKGAIFLPCSELALPVIERGLTELGHRVDKVTVYRNVPRESAPAVDLAYVDEVVFTSPSTVRVFQSFFPSPPARLKLTPIGDQTRRVLAGQYPGHLIGRFR